MIQYCVVYCKSDLHYDLTLNFYFSVDVCFNNPCANGGECSYFGDDAFNCTCPVGWLGDTCAIGKIFGLN